MEQKVDDAICNGCFAYDLATNSTFTYETVPATVACSKGIDGFSVSDVDEMVEAEVGIVVVSVLAKLNRLAYVSCSDNVV